MPEHSTLTDPYLHEPKGVADAGAGLVYVSDGAGSGSWELPPITVSGVLADISTASTIYIPIPNGGTVTKVIGVVSGSITIADAIITVRDDSGASMGTMTVEFVDATAGSVYTLTPASNNVISVDGYITIETDGGSTTASTMSFTALVSPS